MFAPDRVVLWAPWMVLFMPLFGFLILAFLGGIAKKQGSQAGMMALATGCTFASFFFALLTVKGLLGLPPGDDGLRFAQPSLPLNWIDVADPSDDARFADLASDGIVAMVRSAAR